MKKTEAATALRCGYGLMAMALVLMLSSCGLKDDLYFPEATPASEVQSEADAEETEEQASEQTAEPAP